MTLTKRMTAAFAAIALTGTLALTACSSSDDAASGAMSAAQSADVPTVDRSGEGNFPDVEGAFGENPTISAGSGTEPDVILARTLHQGDGAVVGPDDTVVVNYEGTLWTDGTVFDSSFDRGQSISFSLNSVIPGWKYGLADQHVGDRIQLVIPAQWAYGDVDQGTIPPNSTLVFVVDILDSLDVTDLSALEDASETGNTVPGVTVTGDLAAEPQVKITDAAALTPGTTVLAEGKGAKIAEGEQALIHGVALMSNNPTTQSTWTEVPVTIEAAGFNLVGQTVGSRIVQVQEVPLTDGTQSESTEKAYSVIVIDIVNVAKS